jgi:hypothetical protein
LGIDEGPNRIGSLRKTHWSWVLTPDPFLLGQVPWLKRQLFLSGVRAWLTPSATQVPRVRRSSQPPGRQPTATCALEWAQHRGSSPEGVPSTLLSNMTQLYWLLLKVCWAWLPNNFGSSCQTKPNSFWQRMQCPSRNCWFKTQ